MIKKGSMVEFTDKHYMNYPPEDTSVIKYGIAIEDESNHTVKVKRGDGSIEVARYIHAYGWAGWVPDELQKLIEESWEQLEINSANELDYD